jgi:hypothetical protein
VGLIAGYFAIEAAQEEITWVLTTQVLRQWDSAMGGTEKLGAQQAAKSAAGRRLQPGAQGLGDKQRNVSDDIMRPDGHTVM